MHYFHNMIRGGVCLWMLRAQKKYVHRKKCGPFFAILPFVLCVAAISKKRLEINVLVLSGRSFRVLLRILRVVIFDTADFLWVFPMPHLRFEWMEFFETWKAVNIEAAMICGSYECIMLLELGWGKKSTTSPGRQKKKENTSGATEIANSNRWSRSAEQKSGGAKIIKKKHNAQQNLQQI